MLLKVSTKLGHCRSSSFLIKEREREGERDGEREKEKRERVRERGREGMEREREKSKHWNTVIGSEGEVLDDNSLLLI